MEGGSRLPHTCSACAPGSPLEASNSHHSSRQVGHAIGAPLASARSGAGSERRRVRRPGVVRTRRPRVGSSGGARGRRRSAGVHATAAVGATACFRARKQYIGLYEQVAAVAVYQSLGAG